MGLGGVPVGQRVLAEPRGVARGAGRGTGQIADRIVGHIDGRADAAVGLALLGHRAIGRVSDAGSGRLAAEDGPFALRVQRLFQQLAAAAGHRHAGGIGAQHLVGGDGGVRAGGDLGVQLRRGAVQHAGAGRQKAHVETAAFRHIVVVGHLDLDAQRSARRQRHGILDGGHSALVARSQIAHRLAVAAHLENLFLQFLPRHIPLVDAQGFLAGIAVIQHHLDILIRRHRGLLLGHAHLQIMRLNQAAPQSHHEQRNRQQFFH